MIKIIGSSSIGRNAFFSMNASWPLGSLSVSEEQLCISVLLRKVVIRKDEIRRIHLRRFLFWREYRFELHTPGNTPYVAFTCWNLKRVLVALEEYGWQVDLSAKQ